MVFLTKNLQISQLFENVLDNDRDHSIAFDFKTITIYFRFFVKRINSKMTAMKHFSYCQYFASKYTVFRSHNRNANFFN